MKIDLTKLSLPDQVVAVMGVLKRRHESGAKTTFSSDLLGACKHRAFRTQKQRLDHFAKLHRVAAAALAGKDTDKMLEQLERDSVIWEVGDEAMYDGETVRILDIVEAERLATIVGPWGQRTVSIGALYAPTPYNGN